jgi:hypothetical protein
MFKAIGVVLVILQIICVSLWNVSMVRAEEGVPGPDRAFRGHHPEPPAGHLISSISHSSTTYPPRQPWHYQRGPRETLRRHHRSADSGTLDVAPGCGADLYAGTGPS